jgi:hypothetical protein
MASAFFLVRAARTDNPVSLFREFDNVKMRRASVAEFAASQSTKST